MDSPLTLHRALDASLAHGAHYPWHGLQLSNHLPMVLQALAELRAAPAAFERQLAHWARRLVPGSDEELAAAARLAERLAGQGLSPVLQAELPALLLAPESGAFHAMIRLAHALRSGHADETARALSLWTVRPWSLGPLPAGTGQDDDLRQVLARAAADPELVMAPRLGTTIVSDLQAAAALPGFARYLTGLAAPSDAALGLDALAEAALAVYLASRDFTALHGVTGLHAWRVLGTHLAAPPSPHHRRALWRAWFAAWVSIGRPAPDWAAVHSGQAEEACWLAQRDALSQSLDDHRIKLAASALAEWRWRGWPGYAKVLLPAQP